MNHLQENLSRGIIVDPEDEHLLRDFLWSIGGKGYAMRIDCDGGGRITLLLHMQIVDYSLTDHANRNILDNQRSNLRAASNLENTHNQKKHRTYAGKETSSRFKGVSRRRGDKKWVARVRVPNPNGKGTGMLKNLGRFNDELDAAKAYDLAAVELFGEFAATNADLGLL